MGVLAGPEEGFVFSPGPVVESVRIRFLLHHLQLNPQYTHTRKMLLLMAQTDTVYYC